MSNFFMHGAVVRLQMHDDILHIRQSIQNGAADPVRKRMAFADTHFRIDHHMQIRQHGRPDQAAPDRVHTLDSGNGARHRTDLLLFSAHAGIRQLKQRRLDNLPRCMKNEERNHDRPQRIDKLQRREKRRQSNRNRSRNGTELAAGMELNASLR